MIEPCTVAIRFARRCRVVLTTGVFVCAMCVCSYSAYITCVPFQCIHCTATTRSNTHTHTFTHIRMQWPNRNNEQCSKYTYAYPCKRDTHDITCHTPYQCSTYTSFRINKYIYICEYVGPPNQFLACYRRCVCNLVWPSFVNKFSNTHMCSNG